MIDMKYTDREAVELLKPTYPGMSKAVLSMGRKPERYGVELTRGVMAILGMRSRKIEKRRKPCRITFRLTEDEFGAFELARGHDSRQDFCEAIVKEALGL